MPAPDADSSDESDGLTYAAAGVDIDASEAATTALLDGVGTVVDTDYAGVLEVGDKYLGLTTDGVGTKLLVADAIETYDTIGIDCIAMNVNDLVAMGIDPVGFVDYLAIETPDPAVTDPLGAGLATGAKRAGVQLLGGETAVLPELIAGFDLAGAAVGLAPTDAVFDGTAQPGDALVGVPASGIHSNGLTLARQAITDRAGYTYSDPFPPAPDQTIGEVLLEPTRIYTDLLAPFRAHAVRGAAHITGGGFENLTRLGEYQYLIDDPLPTLPVFRFIQESGSITDAEMYRTFNMGTGFVAAVPAEHADALAGAVDGRVIGSVIDGQTGVSVRGISL